MKKTGTEAQEIVDKLKSTFSKKDYTFDDLDKGINIVSVRDRAAGIAGSFDDKLYVTQKKNGVWEVEEYPVTTEPSPNYLQRPAEDVYEKGAAILQPGQWYSYEIGPHKSTYTAVVQSGGPVTVWRDNNYDYNADYENSAGNPETGYFGINIHKHTLDNATAESRDARGRLTRTSAGCTIFKYTSDFESFMGTVKSYKRDTGKTRFSYTLINKVDFDASEPVLPLSLYPPQSERNTHILLAMTSVYSIPTRHRAFLIKTLEINTEVVILRNHLGNDAAWAQVTDNLDNFYIERKYIKSIEEDSEEEYVTKEDPGKQLKQINIDAAQIDWTSQKTDVPYYDPFDGRHKVTVEVSHQDLSTVSIPEILEEGFKKGASILLKENNKNLDILEKVMNPTGSDRAIQAVDQFIPDRGNIRVLVESPDRNMQAFEDASPSAEYYYESEYTTEDFRGMLAKLTGKISSFSEQIASFKGKVSIFDTKREVDSLNQCPDEIEKIFRENRDSTTGIFSEKGFLKIGWTVDMKPVFLEFTSSDQTEIIEVTKGFESFHKRLSISSKRTQNFIFNMQDIVNFALDIPWMQFLDYYADYEVVKITDDSGEKKGKEQKEGPPVKTFGQLGKENNLYNNSQNRISAKEKRETQSDFVGSSYLDTKKFPKLVKELSKTEDELYNAFLNNVDIQGLMLGAAKCLLSSQPIVGSIQNLKNDWDVLKKEYDRLSDTTLEKEMSYFYPDDFPTDDISAEFVKTLRNSISSMVSTALNSLLLSLINSITNLCQDNVENVNITNDEDNLPLPDFSSLKDRIQELFERGNINLDDLRSLFEDLSILLSPNELCSLLEGEPSDNTLELVISLLSRKYCHLGLKTEAQVIDFFASLALEIDFQGCRNIVTQAIPEALDDYICSVDNRLREDLLRGKGLTTEEINDQLAKERERSRKIVENFLKELKEGILSGKAQIPNMFCQKDKEGNLKEGPMPFMDDSLKLTVGTMVQSLIEPIYSSFSKEGRDYSQNFFHSVTVNSTTSSPLDGSSVEIDILARKPLPQIKSFYLSEERAISGNDSSFSISLPIEFAETDISGLLSQAGVADSDISSSLKDKCSASARVQAQLSRQPREFASEVEYVELSACDILGLETPIPLPQEEVLGTGSRNINLDAEREPDCPEDEPEQVTPLRGFLEQPPTIEVQDQNIQFEEEETQRQGQIQNFGLENGIREEILSDPSGALKQQEGITLPTRGCEATPVVGYSVKVGSREIIERKEVASELVEFISNSGYGTNYESISFLKATLENSFSNTEVPDFSVERFVEQSGLHQTIREDILNTFYSFLIKSPYLNQVSRNDDNVGPYILDYVTLGPEPREDCDPHLLKIKQLADKTLEDIENNFCLDLESDTVQEGPRKTNIDSALIRMSVSLTLRHYIIETLSTGILSLSTLQGESDISEIKKKYILERMKSQMGSYDENYYTDFTREAIEEYSGDKNEKTQEQVLIQMISEEYKEIMKGMYNVMLLGGKDIKISEKYLEDSIPVFDRTSLVNADTTNELVASPSKFIFLKDGQNMTLCLSLSTSRYHEFGTSTQAEIPLLSLPPEQEPDTEDNSGTNVFLLEDLMNYEFENQENDQEVELQRQIVEQENQRRMTANAEAGSTELLRNQSTLSADLFFKAITSPTLGDGKYLIPISTIRVNPFHSPKRQKRQFLRETSVKALFEMAYPLDKYESVISIHEIELSSKQVNIVNAFGETRDELYTLFYATLPQTEAWRKTPKVLETFGGNVGLTSIQDFNFGVKDSPCADFSFNLGLDVCWGNPFKGLGISFALKAARDTALTLLKDYIEQNDPNIKLAKKLAFLSKLACVNFDTSYFSGLLAINPTTFPTPLTMLYNALGFGLYESSSSLSSDSDEGERARREVENAGLTLPEYCGAPPRRLTLPEDMTNEQLQSEELSLREALASLAPEYGSLQEQKHIILRSSLSYSNTNTAAIVEGYYAQLGGIPDDKLPLYVSSLKDFHRRRYEEIISQIEDIEQQLEEVNARLVEIREEMEELGIEPLLSEHQQRRLAREEELERIRFERDSDEEEYYEGISHLTSAQLWEKVVELEVLIPRLAGERNEVLNVKSNYVQRGRDLFDSGSRNPDNLRPPFDLLYGGLGQQIDQKRMLLRVLRIRMEELSRL